MEITYVIYGPRSLGSASVPMFVAEVEKEVPVSMEIFRVLNGYSPSLACQEYFRDIGHPHIAENLKVETLQEEGRWRVIRPGECVD